MFYLALFSSSKYGVSSMFWARCVRGSYLCMVIKNNNTMETIEIVMQTAAFQNANNMMVVSPSIIGIFDNAINAKNAGVTYDQWLETTCAGKLSKAIVKEIFAA